ncbi:5'-methylthioadenosine/adenosylhomocysteine nucleosidase [Algoriphagus sp. A40]|uniref:5'-methylthioadenosine/adenosylhomocysteine nucleosidase n=1 Tax=Algoriphagus sp. A40 TaxID=1945863 RepID=UPI00098552F1|nr:5'-methylthioadenosine/adenosylhomocysteine nucleosidase [Algoriphagus sp. A40]OOG74287.1 5'-methylthioadenosine/S-adenosylhomocysteine nucleosidase [Algoriphagus sp. A40]
MAVKKWLFLFLCFFSLNLQAQRIAIMGALDQEIAILLDSMKTSKKVNHGGIDFYTGKLKGKKVVILKAGVGKVNAAYSTAILVENFDPETLIFTGVAGGLHPEALPGDIVIGEKLVQFDFGQVNSTGFTVSPFRKLTGGRHEDLYIQADADLLEKSTTVANRIELVPISGRKPKVFSGVIATGDIFVSSDEKARWLYEEFDALATEMEGAAIAHICRTLEIPFVIIRSCSDNANNHARVNFNQFVGPASVNSARLVLGILEEIQ